jgi:cell division protein ZapA
MSMEEKSATTVEILGREYRIRGNADEGYVREVARFVDERLREVARSTGGQPADRVAILAAMNIADELFQQRRAATEEISRIERRAEGLISLIDEKLSLEA